MQPGMSVNRTATPRPVEGSGTFGIGELRVHRLGYGAMRLTGPGIWGPPKDHGEAIRVLRRAIELGVDLIDTADSYGPYISEELIREALYPYPPGLVIATKAGLVRTGPSYEAWPPVGRPEYLRQECEMSLRRLGIDRIDLFQLHRIDPKVPADEQFGLLRDLQREGKIRYAGLSEVNVQEIEAAQRDRFDRDGAESVQPHRPAVGSRARLLHGSQRGIHSMVSGGLRTAGGAGRRRRGGRQGHGGHASPGVPRLVAPSLAGDVANPRYVQCRPSRGELRGGDGQTHRGAVQAPRGRQICDELSCMLDRPTGRDPIGAPRAREACESWRSGEHGLTI